ALTASAGEVREAGAAADGAASRLASALPDLQRVEALIGDMGGRLAGETTRQLEVIDSLLASVQVRGDEVAAQADTSIVSMNKQLAEIDEASRATTSRIAKRAYALDAAVDGATARAGGLLDSMAQRIGEAMTALEAQLGTARGELEALGAEGAAAIGARLDQLRVAAEGLGELFAARDAESARLRRAVDDHLDALPRRFDAAHEAAGASVAALGEQVTALHGRVEALHEPLAASGATLVTLDGRMAGLQQVADRFAATLAGGLPGATADLGRLEAAAAQLDARIAEVRAGVAAGEGEASAVATLIADLRREVATLGDADLRLVDDRMNATAAVMHDIGRQIAAYGVLSGETKAQIEAHLAAVGRQLRTVQSDGEAHLAALSGQIEAAHAAIDALLTPLAGVQRQLGDAEAQVGHVGEGAAALHGALQSQLAATRDAFAGMRTQATALLDEGSALRDETAAGDAAIAAVAARFANERAAFAEAAATLGGAFDRMRGVLDALDSDTTRVTTETAAALGAAFERARHLAEANAAALRDLLDRIVAETGRTLDERGSALAASAFGDPIRLELAAIGDAATRAGDAAEAAARRVAGQARALHVTVGEVDAKVAEIETRLDVRARDTLSARSSRLIEMLNSAAVDIARLLDVDVGEKAWTRYLKGDRSLFARRTVRAIDPETTSKIARHFAHDAAFHDEASHYLDQFERLSRRLSSDPDGDALLATVVSSDIGKLYVALARATGRWAPAA
ncbi:MAG: hypothetical protein JO290_10565, partial [Sphingomonadaceae bacterium]|nr:hypothetical protein [Sphingomonadaceae bacterium]